ncbi:hypothetical protein EJ02DRAFT_461111 [Clathrospora elynae]|uniref:Uncharacterized protein n=1 Tax=Clathrospora elynae TaxID=706981 RepID=A0A6A5S584_9PLEO|nr:hypothetical protein EJ02DRAFT_461111 [Clathrospora elynae]
MKPASCPSVLFPSRCALRVLSPRVPRSSLRTLVLYYCAVAQSVCKDMAAARKQRA